MKIAALSPQFVFETPAGEETRQAEKAAHDLGLKIIRAESPPESSASNDLRRDAKPGLSRLSQLILEKVKGPPQRRGEDQERRRSRGLALYRALAEPEKQRKGGNFDEFF